MTAEAKTAPDGKDVQSAIAGQLDYLSKLARHLGINDPVEEYFAPVVGRWSDLHAEAERWRVVGEGTEQVTEALSKPLGKLDASWDGRAADSFITYMQQFGLAGHDMSDAMIAMADALDKTADGIREIVVQLAEVMSETAATASDAMVLPVQGDDRTREYLDLMRKPTKELFEAVRQILEGFVQLCEGTDGSDMFQDAAMAHAFPTTNWSVPKTEVPSVPTPPEPPAAPVDSSTDKSGVGGGGGGVGSGGGGGVGGGGLGGGGGAATPANPLSPGHFTVAGEQPARVDVPAAASGGAAAAAAGSSKGGAGGMPMMPMMPMGGQGQGGDAEHKSRSRVVGNPADIFGTPDKASGPVIGGEDD